MAEMVGGGTADGIEASRASRVRRAVCRRRCWGFWVHSAYVLSGLTLGGAAAGITAAWGTLGAAMGDTVGDAGGGDTLGAGAGSIGGGGDGGTVDWKMVASSRSARSLVESIPASGEAGAGFWRASMRSVAAAVAASREEVLGIGVWEG